MKKLIILVSVLFVVINVSAQSNKTTDLNYVNATELTILGKLCETTNPYHRMEVQNIKGISTAESNLLKMASGLAIAFKTNASDIYVKATYGENCRWDAYSPLATTSGFNLFIKNEKGVWTWAASKARRLPPFKENREQMNQPLGIISGLVEGEKECIIYLPLYSELTALEIGVNANASIEKLTNPFRYNIAVFGSSFTHGKNASGAGLTWPAFLSRSTNLHLCSFGMSGNSKLQPYLGEAFGETKADALICDAFSNPTIDEIGERIRPFIESVHKGNPNMPIIFISTIYRENRNFRPAYEKKEQETADYVEKIMAKIVKEYKNVYFVNVPNQTGTDHLTSADGIHPYSYGYHRWAQSIEKPIKRILKKHGIK